ncbi:Oxidoreductase, molybdopterin-binding domain-containing protein [Halenospora varia]|nr:Oxidoreductase, molybdopterin-binding domain-containing protein [Halenospora varia]
MKPPSYNDPSKQNNDYPKPSVCTHLDPIGFYIRHSPPPHLLTTFITPSTQLFQTIHMGGAVIDPYKYSIQISGLVSNPYTLTLSDLKSLPSKTITAFHECYGSPLKPPTENVWRIGNVTWTGVSLSRILEKGGVLSVGKYVHISGLDYGSFGGVHADSYTKDLPIQKALLPDILLAYEMNGQPLPRLHGGPVRLVVPGWFGTNSVKWIRGISLESERAKGPFTTVFYNEIDPMRDDGRTRPVWEVEVNSCIVFPASGAVLRIGDGKEVVEVEIKGWAWSCEGVRRVEVSADGGQRWEEVGVGERVEWSWQWWRRIVKLGAGKYKVVARATSMNGQRQPISGRRNHVHSVEVEVIK